MRKNVGISHLAQGHGRITKEDKIDYLAGIVLEKKIGDKVNKGEVLAYIHANKEEEIENAVKELKNAYEISQQKPQQYKHILNVI